jgi:hypothetical protein
MRAIKYKRFLKDLKEWQRTFPFKKDFAAVGGKFYIVGVVYESGDPKEIALKGWSRDDYWYTFVAVIYYVNFIII